MKHTYQDKLDTVFTRPTPQNFIYYIDEDIDSPSNYRELLNILETMSPMDELKLVINCYGGYLHTTTMLSNAIRTTQGHVRTVLSGVGMSGGSILFLSGHSFEVLPHSVLMAHSSSGGDYGKLGERHSSIISSKEQLTGLYHDVYRGFFTEDEIDSIIEGKDYHVQYEEILERLDTMVSLFEEEAEEQIKLAEEAKKPSKKKKAK